MKYKRNTYCKTLIYFFGKREDGNGEFGKNKGLVQSVLAYASGLSHFPKNPLEEHLYWGRPHGAFACKRALLKHGLQKKPNVQAEPKSEDLTGLLPSTPV